VPSAETELTDSESGRVYEHRLVPMPEGQAWA
jgi:hypothetical protein